MECSISQQVKNVIFRNGIDKFYTADLHNAPVATRTLSRLVKSDFVIRISQGVYLYPKQTEFGPKFPTVYEVAKIIAEKDKSDIIPSGMTVLNELGLSTQMPMRSIYLTNGTPRIIKQGKNNCNKEKFSTS